MTCIVGIADRGKVYIGADSAGVGGYSLAIRSDRKVVTNGPFLIGFTSSFRMGQILGYTLTPPERPQQMDVFKYMVSSFVDSVRQAFRTGGFMQTENGVESGGTFLVGYAGRLFNICSDFQVGENIYGFDAVGCGSDLALGSLDTSSGPPRRRMLAALETAAKFSAGVAGPFHTECLEA